MASALTSQCSTSASLTKVRVLSGARASTSGRLPAAAVPQCLQYASIQPTALSGRFRIRALPRTARLGTAGSKHAVSCGILRSRPRQVAYQAQKSQQETERPVMEQLESDLIAGSSSNGNGNGARSNGSKAPSKNSATNIADKIDTRPAEESQDEGDNNDSGAQSHGKRSGGTPAKAASKVPGGVTEGDNVSAPKPASFWLPHPEAGDFAPTRPEGGMELYMQYAADVKDVMTNAPRTASSFVKRRVQQLMLSNTAVKIGALLLFALPAVLVFGEIYSSITGQPATNGFVKIYSVLLMIPGVNLLNESNLIAGILLNTMFLLGTFTFAVVLGVVSDDISSEVKSIRSGNYPVMDKDHILVLNWNRQTIPLLRQLALTRTEQQGTAQKHSVASKHKIQKSKGMFLADKAVVIMAERNKSDMDADVQQALKGYKIRWQTREGAPFSAADLAKVSASAASTVILMRPDNSRVAFKDDDSAAVRRQRLHQTIAQREVAALLGINSGRDAKAKKRRKQNIIVQAPEDGTDVVTAAKRVITEPGLNTLGLKDRRDIIRLVAQSALQPGVASIHASILQKAPNGVSFYLRDFPQMTSMKYGDVRRRFSTSILCGCFSADDRMPHLNPSDDYVFQEDDKLIFLSNTDNFSPTSHGLAPEFHKFVHEGYSSITDGMPVTEPHAKKLLVVGWCGDIQDLVDSLNMFAPGKTVVTVLCDCCPENWPEDEENDVEFRYLCGNVDHSGALEEAGVCEADAIIIGPAEDLPDNEADASLLSSIIMVQDLLIESQRPRSHPVHVVGVVRCPQTVKVANYMVKDLSQGTMTAELLQPDELVSGLMAQVTSEPVLAPLLSELIHSTEGQEVRLREPADYHIHDLKNTTFAEVAEYARTKTETAIGYVSMQGELFLAPEAGHKHVYRNTDHVVVFAKE
ncbi:hypothetical protein WJX82_007629 [Trebouxia sp. C0006]